MTRAEAVRIARGAEKFTAPPARFWEALQMLEQGTVWDRLAVHEERVDLRVAEITRGRDFWCEIEAAAIAQNHKVAP